MFKRFLFYSYLIEGNEGKGEKGERRDPPYSPAERGSNRLFYKKLLFQLRLFVSVRLGELLRNMRSRMYRDYSIRTFRLSYDFKNLLPLPEVLKKRQAPSFSVTASLDFRIKCKFFSSCAKFIQFNIACLSMG